MNVRVGLGLLGALLVAIALATWWTSDIEDVQSDLDLNAVVSEPQKATREDAQPAAQSRTLSQSPSLPSPVATERRAARIEVRGRFILDDGSEILSPVFYMPRFTGRFGDAPEPPKVAAERGRFVFLLDQPEHLEGFSVWLDHIDSPEMFVLHERDLALDSSGEEQVIDLGDLALLSSDRLVVQVFQPSGQPSRFTLGALLDAEGWFVGTHSSNSMGSAANSALYPAMGRDPSSAQSASGTLVFHPVDEARWLLVQALGFEPELRSVSSETRQLEVRLSTAVPSVWLTVGQGFASPVERFEMNAGQPTQAGHAFGRSPAVEWRSWPSSNEQSEHLFGESLLASLVVSTYSQKERVLVIATPSLERGDMRLASKPSARLELPAMNAPSSGIVRMENDENVQALAKRNGATAVDLSQCDLAVFQIHPKAGLVCFGSAHLQRSLSLGAQVGFAEPQDFIIEQPEGASLALDVRVGHRSSSAMRLYPDADGRFRLSSTCGQPHKVIVRRGDLVDVFDVAPSDRDVTLGLRPTGQLKLDLPNKPALLDPDWNVRLTDQASGWCTEQWYVTGGLTVELPAGRYEVELASEGLFMLPGSRFAPQVVEVQAGGTTQVTW